MKNSVEANLYRLGCVLRDQGYEFTTTTPATHARVNARQKDARPTDLRDIFGWSRPFQQADVPSAMFRLMEAAKVLEPFKSGWRSRVRFSTLQNNLFVHSAFPTDDADAVFFGPDSYRFAAALQSHLSESRVAIHRAADIGCGAGPGAVLVAQARPEAEVWAGDCNENALQAMRVNASLAMLNNIHTRHSNLLDGVEGNFDLIVANPPYLVDALKRSYRHGGGALGAELSLSIVDTALSRLSPGGCCLLYTGTAIVAGKDTFLRAVRERLRDANADWRYHEVDPDVFGEELDRDVYTETERIATVVLVFTLETDKEVRAGGE